MERDVLSGKAIIALATAIAVLASVIGSLASHYYPVARDPGHGAILDVMRQVCLNTATLANDAESARRACFGGASSSIATPGPASLAAASRRSYIPAAW
jgi:hypothetical protein